MVALQKIGIKIFTDSRALKSTTDFIPLFHRWIQENAIPDHLLIDVVDYSHVHEGPGVLLMAHEGIFSLDQHDEKPGLLYARKQPLPGELEDRLEAVLKIVVNTAKRLETEAKHTVAFNYKHFRIIANDRLEAPDNDRSFNIFQQAMESLGEQWGQEEKNVIKNVSTPKGRLEIDWTLSNSLNLDTVFVKKEVGIT